LAIETSPKNQNITAGEGLNGGRRGGGAEGGAGSGHEEKEIQPLGRRIPLLPRFQAEQMQHEMALRWHQSACG
jgi:hypothetical protein